MQPFLSPPPHLSLIYILRIFDPRKREEITDKMKKQILLIAILFCTAFAQAQEVL